MVEPTYNALHCSAMSKTEVYSWRLSPVLKSALEDAARAEDTTLSGLLEHIAEDWLGKHGPKVDEEEQRRLHEAARACFGTISGGDPHRAERASELVREIIWEKHARKRSH